MKKNTIITDVVNLIKDKTIKLSKDSENSLLFDVKTDITTGCGEIAIRCNINPVEDADIEFFSCWINGSTNAITFNDNIIGVSSTENSIDSLSNTIDNYFNNENLLNYLGMLWAWKTDPTRGLPF